ncbi:hypothetical protein A0H81_02472 [Grifola frondosa]|uniref:Retrotransposon Copia-like N-terminal domain-containing protein n=1 Tax=Grifola frondosa TaxID=5627 RepID=A0A1C7MPX0_GRIFR|nr:hypothetical protein A0H81_02472 [Grifola frondosa]
MLRSALFWKTNWRCVLGPPRVPYILKHGNSFEAHAYFSVIKDTRSLEQLSEEANMLIIHRCVSVTVTVTCFYVTPHLIVSRCRIVSTGYEPCFLAPVGKSKLTHQDPVDSKHPSKRAPSRCYLILSLVANMAPALRTRTASAGSVPKTPSQSNAPKATTPNTNSGSGSLTMPPQPKPRTVHAISISGGVLNNSAIPTLDITANNYVLWSTAMESHLQFARLYGYVTGTSTCPSADVDIDSHENWIGNDQSVIGFIRLKCSLEEQKFIRPYTSAHTVWQALRVRHENQGAYSQLLVLRELLSTRFPSASAIPATVAKLDVLLDQFLAHKLPTGDDFRCLPISLAVYPERPFTSSSIKGQLEFEFKRASDSTGAAIALVAKGGPKATSKKICSNCKSTGHLADTCWQDGGGMAGRRDEVLAAKRQQRGKDTAKNSSSQNIQRDTHGRAYLVDSSSGKAFFLTDSATAPTSTASSSTTPSGTSTPATTEFAGLAADVDLALDAPPATFRVQSRLDY